MAARRGGRAPKPTGFRDAATGSAARAAVKEVREAIREGAKPTSPKAAPTKVPSRRWVWGPFAVSGADYALGWAAGRSDNVKYSAVVVGLPLLVAAVLAVCHAIGKPLSGIDRPAEVVYVVACMSGLAGWSAAAAYGWWAAAVCLVSAGWLATCTWMASRPGGLPTWAGVIIGSAVATSIVVVLGPMTGSVRWPAAWLAGTVGAGIPWWAHRSVRRGVNMDPSIKGAAQRSRRGAEVNGTWHRIIEAAQKDWEGLKLDTVKATGSMSIARVGLPGGVTWDKLNDGLRVLESAANLRTGSLSCEPDPRSAANKAVLTHTERDPHATVQSWPGRTATSITTPLNGGVRADGTTGQVVLCSAQGGRNALIGGARGSGKSTGMNSLIAEAMVCDDELSVGFDAKGGGIELGPWFTLKAMPVVATDVRSSRALLTALLAVTQGRGELLRERGRRKWAVGPALDDKKGVDGPHITAWMDEAAQVLGLDPYCGEMSLALGQLSRFAQVSQVVATQFPKAQSLGDAALRGQMDIRIAYRHGTENEAGFTLDGYSNFGDLPAGSWNKKRPGTHLLVDGDDRDSVPVRSYEVAETDLEAVAEYRASAPVLLDEGSYHAALNVLSTILEERAGYLKEDELSNLEADTRQTLHAMTYPAASTPRQRPPAPASLTLVADASPDASGPLADASTPVEYRLPDGWRPPGGVTEEGWLETMKDLDAKLNQLPATTVEAPRVPVREGVPNTSSDEFRRVRGDLEGVRAIILDLLARPDGATRKECMEATGRGRTYVQDRLAELRDGGLAAQDADEYGRWRRVTELTATDRD